MPIPWLEPDAPFPDPALALTERDGAPGLLAAGADLSPQRLLMAYRNGIFPWFSEHQPILWWSTDPRMVLHTAEGLHGVELLHTADIGLFAFGTLAGGLALNWLWATAMTHVASAVVAACYSLVQGLSQFLRSHTA